MLYEQAFVDDWCFFVGRQSNRGISVSSLLFGVAKSLIIFLYCFN
jgi:hypothetical protein